MELIIPKETNGWWPRLLKGSAKVPWVKVDFSKWKDEDEEAEEAGGGFGDFDFSSLGLPGGGAGLGGGNDLGNLSDEDDDGKD